MTERQKTKSERRPDDHQSRLVIFDCDGVLVDSEPVACAVTARVLRCHGLKIDAETIATRFLGRSLTSLIDELSREIGVDLSDIFAADLRAQTLSAIRAGVPSVSGIAELVQDLGLAKCVASGSEPARLHATLKTAGLHHFFEPNIFSASLVARSKPAPDLFLYAADRLGFPPARCVVVEDSVAGIQAARAAHMLAIGFTGGTHIRDIATYAQRLRDAGASYVAGDARELGPLLATPQTC